MHKISALTSHKPQYRLAAKFGDPILDGGHTAIPNLLLEHYTTLGITLQQMLFIIHIIQFKWDPRDPYPGMQTIARRMGMSVRQMQRYEHELISKGRLVVTARHSADGKQLTNEYNFAGLMERVLTIRQSQAAHSGTADTKGAQTRGAETGALAEETSSMPQTLTPMSPSPLTAISPKEDTAQTDSSPDRPEKKRKEQKVAKRQDPAVAVRNERTMTTPLGAPVTAHLPALATSPATDASSQRPSRRDEGLRSIREVLRAAPGAQKAVSHNHPHTPASTASTDVFREAPTPPAAAPILPMPLHPHVAKPSTQAAFQPSIASARIAQLAEDLCREFGDPKLNSTTHQIQTLYQASGLPECGFIDWLLVVRSNVRGSRNKIKRPMAYFMTLLKNTLRRNGLLASPADATE
jgi:hypothetical protein